MSRRICISLGLATVLLCMTPSFALADWQSGGTPVAAVTGEQLWPQLAPDGSGGVFSMWTEAENLRLQHITRDGGYKSGWPQTGMEVPPGARADVHWSISTVGPVEDGEGGVYVVDFEGGPCWAHCSSERSGPVYVTRITRGGELSRGWGIQGVQMRPLVYDSWMRERLAIAPDARHGVFAAWVNWGLVTNGVPAASRLIVQDVAPDGAMQWGEAGVVIESVVDPSQAPVLRPDGAGGALVFWGEVDSTDGATRVHGQHLSASGQALWGAPGRTVSRLPLTPGARPLAVSDGGRGAIVAWSSGVDPTRRLVAVRITDRGDLPWSRAASLRGGGGPVSGLQLATTRAGGAIAVWLNAGSTLAPGCYAQRVSTGGQVNWARDGVPVCTAPDGHGPPVLVSDGRDGAYVAWSDSRATGKLYALRLDSRGHVARGWEPDGSVVAGWQDAAGNVTSLIDGPWLVATGDGAAMVSWDSYQRVLSRTDPISIEQSFVMRLMPDGPAVPSTLLLLRALPAGSSDGPSRDALPAFALHGVRPNPAPTGAVVSFVLSDAQPASLELFDVAGRCVWSRDVSVLGPGEHAVRLRDGAWSPPGFYMVRLTQGERRATTRVAIVH